MFETGFQFKLQGKPAIIIARKQHCDLVGYAVLTVNDRVLFMLENEIKREVAVSNSKIIELDFNRNPDIA